MTVALDQDQSRIVTVDFSASTKSNDDEISQELQNQLKLITEAKEIWIVHVHARSGLMHILFRNISIEVEKIKLISNDFLLTKDLLQNSKTDSSELPVFDNYAKEFYEEFKVNLLDQSKSTVQIIGYKISLKNIQMIRKLLEEDINLQIINCCVTGILNLVNQWIYKSKVQENQKQATIKGQTTQLKNNIAKFLLQKLQKDYSFFRAMVVKKENSNNLSTTTQNKGSPAYKIHFSKLQSIPPI